MEILLRHPWPGNIRELRNLVERLVIVCPQARIEPHHLPPEIFRGVAESPQHPYSTLHEARSAYEREKSLAADGDRKSTRLNSSHANISYAVFCLKKKKNTNTYAQDRH